MTIQDIREKYLAFFTREGHSVIPSASLRPENDPTTLFTGSGMQPLLPYLLGNPHPNGKRLVDSQKCFRAMDIEEVGDNRHTTFFEMLGNWSLGDYFKQEQLTWFFTFLTEEVNLNPEKLFVTVFAGDEKNAIPRDDESVVIWKKLFAKKGIEAHDIFIGSEADGYMKGMQGGRIFYYDAKKNWWSRAGVPEHMPAGEPGGPDSEVFYDFGTPHDERWGKECHPNCDCGRFMEIGNSVFMEYIKRPDGSFGKLPQRNVDFGGGLERVAAASKNEPDVFKIDIFANAIETINASTGKKYEDFTKEYRIIMDHIRASVFLLADGVIPANTDRGYLLRRLLRRAIFNSYKLQARDMQITNSDRSISMQRTLLDDLASTFIQLYHHQYYLNNFANQIIPEILKEEERFKATLTQGLKKFEKLKGPVISADDAFTLFSTHGFPLEMTVELARERGMTVDEKGFEELKKRHQDLSRTGSERKFKGGLADSNEKTTMLHTATHLMLAGLRKYLGDHVHQAGSNITEERTRFDFTHPQKVPRAVLDKVEAYVNEAIEHGATVTVIEMTKDEARSGGVEGSFWEKYPAIVHVYQIQDARGKIYSRELCGGPHVKHAGELGTHNRRFKIQKEEAVAQGVRRIKAVLE